MQSTRMVSIGKRTDQRRAIRTVFERTDRPLTANEVLELAQDEVPGMGIATVYRNLKALEEKGWLNTVELPGEPGRFELASHAHHHYFQCSDCSKVYNTRGCSKGVDSGVPKGFRVDHHQVILYGTCASCTSEQKNTTRSSAD